MNRGLLEAIFSTSTVAAGVNFPARTVVLLQSDRYNGHEFADLTPTELHQMIGRAGRRGKDNIGFALVVPGRYQKPKLIHELLASPPDPIRSQIHINFSMTLNLLLSHTPDEVKVLLARSFAAFQERGSGSSGSKRLEWIARELEALLPGARCNRADPTEVLENIQTRARLRKLADSPSGAYERVLVPGRLFLHKNGKNRGLAVAPHDIDQSVQLIQRKVPFFKPLLRHRHP